MYVLPSTSFTCGPLPSLMNTGVPPTALNARTGELTPPGMSCRALAHAASELVLGRRFAPVLLLLLLVSDITDNIAVPPPIAHGPRCPVRLGRTGEAVPAGICGLACGYVEWIVPSAFIQ